MKTLNELIDKEVKMTNKTEITCKCGCGRKKLVRNADIKRGWGKFYSKSCKAKHQEKRTHQHANYLERNRDKFSADDYDHPFSCEGLGQWL